MSATQTVPYRKGVKIVPVHKAEAREEVYSANTLDRNNDITI